MYTAHLHSKKHNSPLSQGNSFIDIMRLLSDFIFIAQKVQVHSNLFKAQPIIVICHDNDVIETIAIDDLKDRINNYQF